LDAFHRGNDAVSQRYLATVIALSDIAQPRSFLSLYVDQSNELLNYLRTKEPDKVLPAPKTDDVEVRAKYWIAQLKYCDGSSPSAAGEELRQIGLAAIPFLIDALSDTTLVRTFRYARSCIPLRTFSRVGDAAKTIIGVIARDYGLTPPGYEH